MKLPRRKPLYHIIAYPDNGQREPAGAVVETFADPVQAEKRAQEIANAEGRSVVFAQSSVVFSSDYIT